MKRSCIYIIFLISILRSGLSAQSEAELLEQALEAESDTNDFTSFYDSVMAMDNFTPLKGYELLAQQEGMEDLKTAAQIYDQIAQSKSIEEIGTLFKAAGNIHYKNQNYQLALEDFKQALPFLEKSLNGKKRHPILSDAQMSIGNSQSQLKNFEKAVESYQKALHHLSIDFEPENPYDFPSNADYISPLQALKILDGKAQTHEAYYLQGKEIVQLKAALRTLEKRMDLLKQVKRKYQSERYKLMLGEAGYPIHGKAIQMALKLFQLSNDPIYKNKAFEYAEAAKASLLLETVTNQNIKAQSAIPDSLLEKEKAIKIQIAYFKDQIKIGTGSFQNELLRVESDLALLEEKYRPYLAQWEGLEIPLATAEAIQAILRPQEAFISYFADQATLYRFCLNKKALNIDSSLLNSTFHKHIDILKTELSTNHFEVEPYKAFQQFTQHSHQLFQQLIGSIPLDNYTQLIISPDDLLWQIPFETLLFEEVLSEQINYSIEHLPYLLRASTISYANSGSLFLYHQSLESKQKATKSIASYAPSFEGEAVGGNRSDCEQSRLSGLQYNQWEAEQIASIMKGDVFSEQSASKANFLAATKEYQLLHLATHACLDDENPMNNKIFFSDEALDVKDLYYLDINSDLVVLSACETGLGQIKRGEGVLSLARGFTQANCPSIVMSLWKVADDASAELMVPFYQGLKKGYNKSEALRLAKLEFLNQQDKIKEHPYYWAGFVLLGNQKALNTKSDWKKGLLLLGVLGLVLIFFRFGAKSKLPI